MYKLKINKDKLIKQIQARKGRMGSAYSNCAQFLGRCNTCGCCSVYPDCDCCWPGDMANEPAAGIDTISVTLAGCTVCAMNSFFYTGIHYGLPVDTIPLMAFVSLYNLNGTYDFTSVAGGCCRTKTFSGLVNVQFWTGTCPPNGTTLIETATDISMTVCAGGSVTVDLITTIVPGPINVFNSGGTTSPTPCRNTGLMNNEADTSVFGCNPAFCNVDLFGIFLVPNIPTTIFATGTAVVTTNATDPPCYHA